MSYQKQSFGMMDEGYFVPRTEIVDWINKLLDLNITKIQMLGAGSIYCQIVDVIHPGKVAMNKVNWKAKSDYEFINNLKILQTAFDKAGVKRYVQVQKLAKAKYQDNLQFIQWLKRYYDLNCGDRGNDYNAQERRGNVKPDFSFAQKNVVPKTFNSGGQITQKTTLDPPPKKVETKVETKIQHKIQTKVQQKQPKQPIKKTTIISNKSAVVQKKSQIKPTTSTKVKQETKLKRNQLSPQHQYQKQKKQKEEKNEKQLMLKYNDLDMKFAMARQILSSEDSSEMKVKLLEQIFEISKKSKSQSHNKEQITQTQYVHHQVETHQIAIGNDQNQQNNDQQHLGNTGEEQILQNHQEQQDDQTI